jgi:uncharacterized protein YjbJ (UPF0337 family)
MNKDQVKGAIDEVVGSAKRKAGELTGDTELQVKGMVQQVKGKVENAWGKAKEVVQEANEEAAVQDEMRMKVELQCSATNTKRNKSK